MLNLKEIKHHLIVNMSYQITKQLLKEKIYSKVVNNICQQVTIYYTDMNLAKRCIDELLKDANTNDLIMFGFNWNNTPEGFNFWYRIYWENE